MSVRRQPPQRPLVAGRIDPQKNQLLLVEAFAALVADQPDTGFRLLLGGPVTSPSYLQEIKDLIHKHQLNT